MCDVSIFKLCQSSLASQPLVHLINSTLTHQVRSLTTYVRRLYHTFLLREPVLQHVSAVVTHSVFCLKFLMILLICCFLQPSFFRTLASMWAMGLEKLRMQIAAKINACLRT